jgi:hypothetical protein
VPDVPLNFNWEVIQAGYRWLETHAMGQSPKVRWHYLTPVSRRGSAPYMARRYHPLSAYSGLFRTFAATELSLDGVKAFADRFGLLGGDLSRQIVLLDQGREGKRPGGVGEHVHDWLKEIVAMQRAVDLWEAARQGDAEHLGRIIFWSDDHRQDFVGTAGIAFTGGDWTGAIAGGLAEGVCRSGAF